MEEKKLYSTFEQDTKKFINEINDSLIKLENEGYSFEEINHIFRCIHSIKSEAGYLNLNEISSAAHEMESAIEPLRNVGIPVEVDPALIDFCFASIDKIGALAVESMAADVETVEEVIEVLEEEVEDEEEDIPGNNMYSDFEIMLLCEAYSRGEKLYKLSFGISEDEAMKYPRAYLAVSNLEQTFNVIKVEPDPEEIDGAADRVLTVILTSALSGSDVVERINIDQLVDIRIGELSFDEQLENPSADSFYPEIEAQEEIYDAPVPADGAAEPMEAEPTILPRERVISVDAEEIDAISAYVSEIKSRLTDLNSAISTGAGEDPLNYDLAGLERISSSIEGMMNNIKTVDFYSHFAGYKRTVRDIALETGKKAELNFTGESLRVPRDFAEFIADPLLQVIRNAVVHGIEPPEERGGKGEKGTISVNAEYVDDSLIISVSDDGAGINTETIPEAYGKITTDGQLLELLTQPGYTTLKESGKLGGRGVGLDLVANRIGTRGGRIELINRTGLGCEFKLIFKGLKNN